MDDKIILHGNHAKIDSKKKISPRDLCYVAVQNTKNKSDEQLEADADFCRDEVNANQK